MTTTARPVEAYQAKDYKSDLKPIWCPGCGDFGVLNAIYELHLTILMVMRLNVEEPCKTKSDEEASVEERHKTIS